MVSCKKNNSFLKFFYFSPKISTIFSLVNFIIGINILFFVFNSSCFGELWTQVSPSGTSPSARVRHSAIYNFSDNSMIVFGGWDGSYKNDVWKLTLGGSPTWTQLSPSGTPPSIRGHHTAIYNSSDNSMIVFGGGDGGSGNNNEVWKLSLGVSPSWTQLSPSGTPPSARWVHTAIYNSSDNSMIIFGGNESASPPYNFKNEVWKLTLGGSPTWTQLSPSGTPPSARNGHAAIYNSSDNSMVIFGGNTSTADNTLKNDVWKLTLGASPSWTEVSPTGTVPTARQSQQMGIYNPSDNSMIIFGGNYGNALYKNDVWKLTLGGSLTWTQLLPSGTVPSAREGSTEIYNSLDNSLIIFGGWDNSPNRTNDVWKLEFSTTKITKDTTETVTVEANDGSKTKIVIPPGSLDRDVIIKVTRDTTITDGIAYNFKITDATTGNEIENFLNPVTITIYYTITNGKVTNTDVGQSDAASKLSIYYYDRVKWNKQKSEIDTINKFLSISTTHASIYAIKSVTDVSTYYGGEVVVTPNPFTPNNDGVNDSVSFYFDNPNNENTTIKIFRRDGLLVRTLENITSWDGKDDNGNNLDSGLYLWQLEIGGVVKKRGTVILAR